MISPDLVCCLFQLPTSLIAGENWVHLELLSSTEHEEAMRHNESCCRLSCVIWTPVSLFKTTLILEKVNRYIAYILNTETHHRMFSGEARVISGIQRTVESGDCPCSIVEVVGH